MKSMNYTNRDLTKELEKNDNDDNAVNSSINKDGAEMNNIQSNIQS